MTFLAWAIARMVPKAARRDLELVRYEGEEVVIAKSSTYERTRPWGREINYTVPRGRLI